MRERTRCTACGAEYGDPDQSGLLCGESKSGLHKWWPRPNDRTFMDTGTALEIVHGMATRAYEDHTYVSSDVKAEAKLALDTVEDFIANKFEEG